MAEESIQQALPATIFESEQTQQNEQDELQHESEEIIMEILAESNEKSVDMIKMDEGASPFDTLFQPSIQEINAQADRKIKERKKIKKMKKVIVNQDLTLVTTDFKLENINYDRSMENTKRSLEEQNKI